MGLSPALPVTAVLSSASTCWPVMPRASAERVDGELGRQHEHDEDEPRHEQRGAGCHRDAVARFYDL